MAVEGVGAVMAKEEGRGAEKGGRKRGRWGTGKGGRCSAGDGCGGAVRRGHVAQK